ncbi:MAG: hypothetical protein JNM17_32155 [Archangium sp.]|nr:hypothetical protein [Archangium sp.]
MRVVIYDDDRAPEQAFLRRSWQAGCALQKALGLVDETFAASTWEQAFAWLTTRPEKLTSIQYWGHGHPGEVLMAREPMQLSDWAAVKPLITRESLVWFRTCSTFQGEKGHAFSEALSTLLDCTIAGHTRIIGPLQGGLHTRRPHEPASWPIEETELPPSRVPPWLRWGNNTIVCLTTQVPAGW